MAHTLRNHRFETDGRVFLKHNMVKQIIQDRAAKLVAERGLRLVHLESLPAGALEACLSQVT